MWLILLIVHHTILQESSTVYTILDYSDQSGCSICVVWGVSENGVSTGGLQGRLKCWVMRTWTTTCHALYWKSTGRMALPTLPIHCFNTSGQNSLNMVQIRCISAKRDMRLVISLLTGIYPIHIHPLHCTNHTQINKILHQRHPWCSRLLTTLLYPPKDP